MLALLVALLARPILLTLGIPAVPKVTEVPAVPPMTAWMWVEWLIMNLTQGFGLRLWFTSSLDFLVSYFFGLALLLGVRATLALRDAELARAELQNAWMQSRLQVLRMQLNPHFLFNALNTVATMLERRPGEARALAVSLGHLLRRTLDSADREWNSLAEEVDLAERYLAIQAARFDGRLSYHFEIEPALQRARVPAMILQPLVENAVLHGVGDDRDRLRVWVAAQRHRPRNRDRQRDHRPARAGLDHRRRRAGQYPHQARGLLWQPRIAAAQPAVAGQLCCAPAAAAGTGGPALKIRAMIVDDESGGRQAVRAELRTMIEATLRSLGEHAGADPDGRLILEVGGHVHLIPPTDVTYAEANGNYMSLCVRGQRHTVRCTMNDLERRLAPPRFLRIQRSVLVNTAHIRSIDK